MWSWFLVLSYLQTTHSKCNISFIWVMRSKLGSNEHWQLECISFCKCIKHKGQLHTLLFSTALRSPLNQFLPPPAHPKTSFKTIHRPMENWTCLLGPSWPKKSFVFEWKKKLFVPKPCWQENLRVPYAVTSMKYLTKQSILIVL